MWWFYEASCVTPTPLLEVSWEKEKSKGLDSVSLFPLFLAAITVSIKAHTVEERRASELRRGGISSVTHILAVCQINFSAEPRLTTISITTEGCRPRKEWGKIVWRKEIKEIKYTVNFSGELSNLFDVTESFSTRQSHKIMTGMCNYVHFNEWFI